PSSPSSTPSAPPQPPASSSPAPPSQPSQPPPPSASTTASIDIAASGFVPSTIAVAPGDPVEWRNTTSTPVTLTISDDLAPRTVTIAPGQSETVTFATVSSHI